MDLEELIIELKKVNNAIRNIKLKANLMSVIITIVYSILIFINLKVFIYHDDFIIRIFPLVSSAIMFHTYLNILYDIQNSKKLRIEIWVNYYDIRILESSNRLLGEDEEY